jgi:hypothetical protein
MKFFDQNVCIFSSSVITMSFIFEQNSHMELVEGCWCGEKSSGEGVSSLGGADSHANSGGRLEVKTACGKFFRR